MKLSSVGYIWLFRLVLHFVNSIILFDSRGIYAFQFHQSIVPRSKASHSARQRRISNACSINLSDAELPEIENVERIFAISDLHTDNTENIEWLKEMCYSHKINNSIGPNDAIIIAGDISHELSTLRETFCVIKEYLNCHIFFVWGNHEAWIGGQEMDSLGVESSLQKIELVKLLCDTLDIHTECRLVGTGNDNPVCILPIESWYDATLSLNDCEDLCVKFDSWRWVDFMRCVWPEDKVLMRASSIISRSNQIFVNTMSAQNTGQIPKGLTEILAYHNSKSIKKVRNMYNNWVNNDYSFISKKNGMRENRSKPPGLITFSHFLPNQKTLPDWKDPTSDSFNRDEWLDHPVPEISAKFAKVAGSMLIDDQIRSVIPYNQFDSSQPVQHLHLFGHSHRPKDFVYDNIRYIHNPLGKPAEREMNMVSQNVGFQLIWDCTSESLKSQQLSYEQSANDNIRISSVGVGGGEIAGRQVIRYWEEQGGGKEVLARKMKHRRRRNRLEVKRFVRELELTRQSLNSPETNK